MKSQKITRLSGRRYADACGAAHALDLLGERWALLVVRELMFGAKRFSGIRAALPGISANVLSQRLEGLEAAGVVERRMLPPPASARVYALTQWGLEAEPIFQALGRWAARSPAHDPTLPFSAVSLMLSLRTMFDPARAGGTRARIGFRTAGEGFVATVAGTTIVAERIDPDPCDAIFAGAPETIAAAIYGGVPLAALEGQGALAIEGDRALAARFVTWFPLPAKVAAAPVPA